MASQSVPHHDALVSMTCVPQAKVSMLSKLVVLVLLFASQASVSITPELSLAVRDLPGLVDGPNPCARLNPDVWSKT